MVIEISHMKDLCLEEMNNFLRTHYFSLFDLLIHKIFIFWTNIPQNFDLKISKSQNTTLYKTVKIPFKAFHLLPFFFISSKDLNTIRIIKIILRLKD